MTKEEFREKYEKSLSLSSKKWKFISAGNRKGFMVSISGLGEIDLDFLYYNYAGKIWEIDLNQTLPKTNTTLRSLLRKILNDKKSDVESINFIELKSRSNDQVAVDLNIYGRTLGTIPTILQGKQEKIINATVSKPVVTDELDLFSKIRNRPKEELILDDIVREILLLSSSKTLSSNKIELLISKLQWLKKFAV